MATVNDYARTTWQTGDVIDATKMNNIETQLDALTDNARDNGTAPVFSTTKTYAVGEHVLYNGEVYRCKTAVTNAGAWVANNWVKAYLSSDMEGEVSELKSALNATTGIAQIPLYAANRYIDLSGTSVVMVDGVPQLTTGSTAYSVSMIQCSAGDVFTINGIGGSTPRLWGFVSSTGTILKRSAAGVAATNAIITAPTNAAWIITHTNDGRVSYKGKIIPIKFNEIDTEIDTINDELSHDIPIIWEMGNIGAADGVYYSSTNRARERDLIKRNDSQFIVLKEGAKFTLRYYDANGTFKSSSPSWHTSGNTLKNIVAIDNRSAENSVFYKIVIALSDDSNFQFAKVVGDYLQLKETGNLRDLYSKIYGNSLGIATNTTGKGNCSIRCAKEQSYIDGTHPVIAWYLLEEPNTGRFYYSKDLSEKKFLFTFPYYAYKYSVGILQNNDIIFVMDADSITLDNKDDANRVNPYVFLASENWSICHEVEFGASLKPCGWLGNCGFKVIANGDVLFCEYTRQTTYTCNVWKLSGDPLDATNWVVTKSFVVTSTDNATLFKHAHMVMQDFYTGVCYFATGDDLIGAMLWASTDNGDTWTQLVSPDSDGQVNQYGYINGSEKYCRMLTMTFTKDYIYWATDSSSAVLHWLFRAQRDANGVLDYSTVEDWVNIPENHGASTYGTAYIPELNAIVLLDRCDVVATEMDLKLVTLDDGQLHTFGRLESASGSRNIGFRTRFSEWYPKTGLIHVGYDLHIGRLTNTVNQNKGFNNSGSGDHPENNINNLAMQVYKAGNSYGMTMHTEFI